MSSTDSDDRLASYLRRFSPSPSREPDAGLRALSHYERKLPRWRHELRRRLIPIVRWETPYLARLQATCRSNFLDSYFAVTANLGTHTFFMTFLPICFWCGYPDLGIALVHMLALGVYFTCVLKDLVCLPRPLSPPLQRITMSGSAALEYGFPSTHTTNAVSVAVFALHQLYMSRNDWSPTTFTLLLIGCYCYATSITVGRMYCGMHGFFDIAIGAVLGAAISWFRICYGNFIDIWIVDGTWVHPALAIIALALAVRIHPEPADNCPCFDDSVAFLGVVMGTSLGTWHNARRTAVYPESHDLLARIYPYTNDNILKSVGRLLGGILLIFLWRAMMKPLLLRYLPSIFRFVDHWGLIMPRRYFLQARDYKSVPHLRKDDNVLPSASDIPSMLQTFRYPRRRRISVGPQSEADARELLANRQEQRKKAHSVSEVDNPKTGLSFASGATAGSIPSKGIPEEQSTRPLGVAKDGERQRRPTSSLQGIDRTADLLTPPIEKPSVTISDGEQERKDQAMFSALEKPRTHYDVEVITKLIVYAGIAWLAVEGNPIWFERLGLV